MRKLFSFMRDRDNALATFTVVGVLVALVLGYGERQQRDETLTAQAGHQTAYAAKD